MWNRREISRDENLYGIVTKEQDGIKSEIMV
jgi:hypothetical protein